MLSPLWRFVCIGVAAVMFIAAPATAAAEPPPTEEELFDRLTSEQELEVIRLLDEAEEAYDADNYGVAIDRFHEVHELFPHPRITYRLALAYEEAREYEMALQYYTFFLEQAPDAEERGEVGRKVRDLEDQLGDDRTMIRVESVPIGADIYLGDRDTAPVGTTPQWVTVEPGSHDIIVDLPGYLSEETTVEIAEGDDEIVQFELDADESFEDDDYRQVDTSGVSLWKPAVSVGLAGVGGLFTYMAFQQSADARYMEDNLDDPAYSQADVDNARATSTTFGVVGGVTLVSAAAFTVWWVFSDRGGPGSGLSLAPTPGGVQVGFTHRF